MSLKERGDTLVEVLIAVSILSMAIVGGMTIMSYGYSIANNAVERTQVQATMNGQLALISYARDAYIRANKQATDPGSQLWAAIDNKVTNGSSSAAICSGSTPQPGANSFYIDSDLATLDQNSVIAYNGATATTLAQPGSGMWIEARRSGGSISYIEFYVKACWAGTGSAAQQEAKTVMRLYVP